MFGQVFGSGRSSRFVVTFSQMHVSVSGCQMGVEPGLHVVAALQMNSASLELHEHFLVAGFQNGCEPSRQVVAIRHFSFSGSSMTVSSQVHFLV